MEDGIPAIVLPPEIMLIEKSEYRFRRLLRRAKDCREPIGISDLFNDLEEEEE